MTGIPCSDNICITQTYFTLPKDYPFILGTQSSALTKLSAPRRVQLKRKAAGGRGEREGGGERESVREGGQEGKIEFSDPPVFQLSFNHRPIGITRAPTVPLYKETKRIPVTQAERGGKGPPAGESRSRRKKEEEAEWHEIT